MATGIFAILDDVAVLLDDAAVLSKVAAKKTAGILGDDLAVNAEKATGFHASRELPVLWAITKGSFVNKVIILPVAFLLSAFVPWAIVPILLIGGTYLCFEGAEKILEWIIPHEKEPIAAQETGDRVQILEREKAKIKAAVRTDFILSVEIVVIALGTVMEQSVGMRVAVVSAVALLATVGVYGLVALLVRMDDAGVYLLEVSKGRTGVAGQLLRRCGNAMVAGLPYIIRMLGVVGTIAMLLVGGGMFVHNIPFVHHLLRGVPSILADLLAGLAVGGVAVGCLYLVKAVWKRDPTNSPS